MDNNHSETYDINEILNLHRINDEKRDKRSEIDSKVMNFCLIAITISVCAVIWFYIILAMVKIISGDLKIFLYMKGSLCYAKSL